MTPVDLDLAGLAAQIADLAERTRDNKLKPDELAGGTFTLTNTGSRGALFDTPVVFLPQSAILGTGIVVKRPVVVSDNGMDAIAIRSMVYLALSYDHRIVDGADAARFLVAVKDRLEAGDFEGDLGIYVEDLTQSPTGLAPHQEERGRFALRVGVGNGDQHRRPHFGGDRDRGRARTLRPASPRPTALRQESRSARSIAESGCTTWARHA